MKNTKNNGKFYTVYLHVNNETEKAYVGLTSLKPECRWQNGKGYIKNEEFFNDILKYGWDGFSHILVYQGKDKDLAESTEASLITRYRKKNLCYNLESGGYSGFKELESTKEKMREAHLGKHHSEETKEKIKESHLGKHHSEETKEKIKESHLGKHHSEETKEKIKESSPKVKVVQVELNSGEVLMIYPSVIEASRQTGINQGNICSACSGNLKTAGGFIWKYLEYLNILPGAKKRGE